MFDAVSGSGRAQVRYADGTVASGHRVTDLDRPAGRVQQDIAGFVELCARIRVHYQLGETVRTMFDRVSAAEGTSSPELQGSYAMPPMPPRVAERRHADVWHALVKVLDGLGVPHSNARIGRFGPDLLALGSSDRFLFEIKPDITAADIQCAIGQLQLYEHLGKVQCRKVMVLPEEPRSEVAGALEAFAIEVVCFERKGAGIRFDDAALQKLLKSRRRGSAAGGSKKAS